MNATKPLKTAIDWYQDCKQSPISEWAMSKEVLENGPWLVYIGLTNLCNLKCRVCAREKAMRKEKGMMSTEVFERIVDQLPKSVRKVYLMKQGESLLNKNFEIFAKYLRDKRPDIYVSFHTNATYATQSRMKSIIPIVDSIGLSIGAITEHTYNDVHGKNYFSTVIENLRDISDLLNNAPANKRPHVFIDYVSQTSNSSEARNDVVEFYKTKFTGISSVDFHSVYDFQGEIDEGKGTDYNLVGYANFPTCVWPWASMTFCYDGKVSYCFVEPRENRFLGDITQQTFDEIWNGEEYVGFRNKMLAKKFGELADDGFYCNKCSWLWNTRSQAPRSLAGGYCSGKSATPLKPCNELLATPLNDLFALASQYYLEGEIPMAIACLKIVTEAGNNPEMAGIASSMLNLCDTILRKYTNLNQQQDTTSLAQSTVYNPLI